MSDSIIEVEDLSKLYRLGTISATTLRESVTRWFRSGPNSRASKSVNAERGDGNSVRPNASHHFTKDQLGPVPHSFWALKGVSFKIQQGEVVGIIGRNGAGKSTLLKILSRITEPTHGTARIRGRVASLLEVGTGFHPELTGRENIFLNGSILGMRKGEIRRKLDEIIAFAEVEEFIDTPVKRYSSGMYVRLAFAVAAHLEPEILIIDEVLAVGDAQFQKKCLGKMGEVANKQGRTVLFVSHSMPAVQNLCPRSIWIHRGQLTEDGPSASVIDAYLARISSEAKNSLELRSECGDFVVEKVWICNEAGEQSQTFKPGDTLVVEIHYNASRAIKKPSLWVGIASQFGPLFGASMLLDGHAPDFLQGKGCIRAVFPNLPLQAQQTYIVRVGGRQQDGHTFLFPTSDAGSFRVMATAEEMGYTSSRAESLLSSTAPLTQPYFWELPNGETVEVDPIKHFSRKTLAAAC